MSPMFLAKDAKYDIPKTVNLDFPVKYMLCTGKSSHNIKIAFYDKMNSLRAYIGNMG